MLKGLKYFITYDHGLIQMIDFWTFINEIPNKHGKYDYEIYMYHLAYQ